MAAAAFVACLALVGSTASAQSGSQSPETAKPPVPVRVKAQPGETCQNYFTGCNDWCAKNLGSAEGCLNYCKEQSISCRQSGEWLTDNGTKIVFGLPPG
jgi:hypothetical protein